MGYLSKEEKQEYKEVKRFMGFEISKLIILLLVLSFIFGGVGVGYKLTIGKANIDADREIFEHSKSYIHGMVDDLAKYKFELAKTEDKIERSAINEVIVDRFSSFDSDLIEDASLRQFLLDVRNGNLK